VVACQCKAERERARVVAQLGDAGLDHRAERRWQRQLAQVLRKLPAAALVAQDRVVHQVLRVLHAGLWAALRELVQPARRAVESVDLAEQRLEQRARVLGAQPRQLDQVVDVHELFERRRRVGEHACIARRQEQQALLAGQHGQASEHAERSAIGPVHVVDGDQQRLVAARRLQQRHERGRQRARSCGGIELGQGRLVERAAQGGGCVPEHGRVLARDLGGGRPDVEQPVRERGGERERTRADRARVDEDGGGARQLGFEHGARQHPAAAQAGGRDDRGGGAAALHRAQQQLAQKCALLVAADERRIGEERLGHASLVLGRQLADRGQALDDLARRRGPAARVEAQERHHQVRQRARQLGLERVGSRGPALPQLAQVIEYARGIRVALGQQEVRERSERVQIGARVERLHVHRLGRHERRRAGHAGLRAHGDERAEVDQLGAAVRRAPDVAHAEVAMDQAPRMDQRQRRCRVAQPEADLLHARRALAQRLACVGALEQLHRVVGIAVVDAVVEDAHDARMRELDEGVVLALEHRAQRGIALAGGDQLLERDPAPGAFVSGAKHARGAAVSELGLEAIAPADESLRCLGHRNGRPASRGGEVPARCQ
jgi:hypothetical protein